MGQPRYTPEEFIEGIKSQEGNTLTPEQEAFLYGMVVGRLSVKNRTDGKITYSEAQRLIAIYNTMSEAKTQKTN